MNNHTICLRRTALEEQGNGNELKNHINVDSKLLFLFCMSRLSEDEERSGSHIDGDYLCLQIFKR